MSTSNAKRIAEIFTKAHRQLEELGITSVVLLGTEQMKIPGGTGTMIHGNTFGNVDALAKALSVVIMKNDELRNAVFHALESLPDSLVGKVEITKEDIQGKSSQEILETLIREKKLTPPPFAPKDRAEGGDNLTKQAEAAQKVLESEGTENYLVVTASKITGANGFDLGSAILAGGNMLTLAVAILDWLKLEPEAARAWKEATKIVTHQNCETCVDRDLCHKKGTGETCH